MDHQAQEAQNSEMVTHASKNGLTNNTYHENQHQTAHTDIQETADGGNKEEGQEFKTTECKCGP